MSRTAVYALYALLVIIWSSTWVAIKIGLEDAPALLGAGIRFALAGALLVGFAALTRRPLRTDWLLAGLLALFPFALTYGLIYWGEQYIPSGLTAVLFGVMPLYTAMIAALLLHDEPLRARLLVGVLIALGGLALAFSESLELGAEDLAAAGALAVVLSPLGASIGNISTKRREGGLLDAIVVNGWGMLAGGILLLLVSALSESWGDFVWSAESAGSILYLAIIGSAVPFVGLMVLLRHLKAQTISFIAMLIPFGALALGALIESEPITAQALAGAALVAAGLLVAQSRRDSPPDSLHSPSAPAPSGAFILVSYAVVRVGGKQYRVEEGDSIVVDRMSAEEGDKVDLEPLLFADGDKSLIASDELGRIKVQATVTGHERGKKIHGLKFKPKRGYKRRYGARSHLTRLEINSIKAGARRAAAKKREDSNGS